MCTDTRVRELLRVLHGVVGEDLSSEAARFAPAQDETARQAGAAIEAALAVGTAPVLVRLFQEGGLPWEVSASVGREAANGFVAIDELSVALATLGTLIERHWKSGNRLRLQRSRQSYAEAFESASDDYCIGINPAAVKSAPTETSNRRSTWTQACRLLGALQPTAEQRAAVWATFEHLPDGDGPAIGASRCAPGAG